MNNTAGEMVEKYGKDLIGKTVLTAPMGEYPGGLAIVTEIEPDENNTEIALNVNHPVFESMGIFYYEEMTVLPSHVKIKETIDNSLLEKFRLQALDGNFIDVTKSADCYGLCEDVSIEFKKFIGYGELLWLSLKKKIADYPVVESRFTGDKAEHCVVIAFNTVYDWTPKQFDNDLPVPYIWDLSCMNEEDIEKGLVILKLFIL